MKEGGKEGWKEEKRKFKEGMKGIRKEILGTKNQLYQKAQYRFTLFVLI